MSRRLRGCMAAVLLALYGAPFLFAAAIEHASAAGRARVPDRRMVEVLNAGVAGENTKEIHARAGTLLASTRPDVVVIFAGTNDVLNEAKFLSLETSMQHLDVMVRAAKSHGAAVILVTLHQPDVVRLLKRHRPEAYGGVSPPQRIARFNVRLAALAKRDGVFIADFHSALLQVGGAVPEYSTDGVHLTRSGYGILATVVAQAIYAQSRPVYRVLCLGDSLTFGTGVRSSALDSVEPTYPGQLEQLLRHEGWRAAAPR